jgi:hypothetical protein
MTEGLVRERDRRNRVARGELKNRRNRRRKLKRK